MKLKWPRKSKTKDLDNGSDVPAQNYSIGPLERTLIQRLIKKEPFIANQITQAVRLAIDDPLNIEMPKILPEEYTEEEWYVDINHTTNVHRLVVSFDGPQKLFSYCQAFVVLRNGLPESVQMKILADGPAIAKEKRRLSHYIDMTSINCNPRITEVKLSQMLGVMLVLEQGEDLMPWPVFEKEICQAEL